MDIRAGVHLVEDLRGAALPAADAERDQRIEHERGEGAVLSRGDGDLLHCGRPVAAVGLFGAAVVDAAHGRAKRAREQRGGVGVCAGAVLGAEAAPHVVLDHPHLRLRHAECLGDVAAHAEDPLRGLPHGELVAIPLADGAVRLERGVQCHLRAVLARDRHFGVCEAARDVTALYDVGFGGVAFAAHERRVGRDGVVHGHRMRRGLDDNRGGNHARGTLGGVQRFRADGGERLAGVRHLALEEPRGGGRVAGAHNGAHARHGACGVEIHGGERPLGSRCAHDDGVEHAGADDVGGVARAPGDLFERVHAQRTGADDGKRRVRGPRGGLKRRYLDHTGFRASLDLDSRLNEPRALAAHGAVVPASATARMAVMILG